MTEKRATAPSTYVNLTVKRRWTGTAWTDLTIGKRWDGAAWQNIFAGGGGGGGALSVTASQGTLVGFVHATGPYPLFQTVYTQNSVTISVSGGTGPYTYRWTHASGDSAVQVESSSSAITRMYANVGREREVGATKRCTVTDSLGATDTVDVGGLLYYTTDL